MENILNAAQQDDQGSEAIGGFDFQTHCIARLCLDMVGSHEISEVYCEHHEDLTLRRNDQTVDLCQIKKRESVSSWTINLLKEPIRKLFTKLMYKNVHQMVIYGSGRASIQGKYSMAAFMALLDRPLPERDDDWDMAVDPYCQYLGQLLKAEFDQSLIRRGVRILRIDLTMPHPDAIETENIRLAITHISKVWDVAVSWELAGQIYASLLSRVWQASRQAKRPLSSKRITNQQARAIVQNLLHVREPLATNNRMILDLHGKLQKGKLENYLIEALQMRMDARQVKYELELGMGAWLDFRFEIQSSWEQLQCTCNDHAGPHLWKEIRHKLCELGDTWIVVYQNPLVGPEFATGVFFDMMAICEVDIQA